MVCQHCGKELPPQVKFCTNCGAVVPAPAPAPAPVPTPAPAPAPAPAPVEKKSGVKPLLIVLIILAAVILITLIVVSVILLGGKSNKPDTPAIEDNLRPTVDIQLGDGNPVPEGNPYRDCYNEAVGFVLPDSAERYYSRADLARFNAKELKIALNEIFARRGATFNELYVQEYFDAIPWYEPVGGSPQLNAYEDANAVLLDVMVREQEGMLMQLNNPYLVYRDNAGSQKASDSNSRYLDADDLETLTLDELVICRSEILARHGVIFQDKALLQYFSCKDWYAPSVEEAAFDTEATLCDYEIANTELIGVYENILSGKYKPSADNKYVPYYNPMMEEMIYESDDVELSFWDLDYMYLTPEQLIIARNEVMARHGYTFGSQALMEYFTLCSWYRPSIAPNRDDLLKMSELEYKNVQTIYEYEHDEVRELDVSKLKDELSYKVSTDMYTIYLPKYWKDYAIVNKSGYSLEVYEKPSYKNYDMGYLFTLSPVKNFSSDPYSDYEILGTITDGNGNEWTLVCYGPFDVPSAYYNLYGKMHQDMYRAFDSIEWKDGYTFIPN